MDINSLRKNRQAAFSKVVQGFEQTGQKNWKDEDEGYWKLTRDKAGNGSAVIRFLPSPDDNLPFVRMFDHAFQGPNGKWYIEKSLTTIGEADPVAELNSKLWDSNTEANKEQAREQKRRTSFVSYIEVVKDYGNPDNNGKVFKYKYGKKIFDMLQAKAKPTFADQNPVNVFDLWEGCNFRLRCAVKDGFPNYDQSEFDAVSPVGDDERIVEVMNIVAESPLTKLLDRSNFKSYDELESRLKAVLGSANVGRSAEDLVREVIGGDAPAPRSAPAPEPKASPAPSIKSAEPAPIVEPLGGDSDDDLMNYFSSVSES